MSPEDRYHVHIGTDCVTIRKKGESRLRVGTILGRESNESSEQIYVDRLLLSPGTKRLTTEWSASGCVSTILTRSLG